ncbi:hypothetical protein EYF80_064674 [Liparis tanakae]|uniref:Uncharacterized protein n=1 Tax=Liparis tanakae TaxID=230148 RepID=A0A4Z2E8Q6_9TELE|nr:hypothetical protein EYF80_064674 [Liparis tanakae]
MLHAIHCGDLLKSAEVTQRRRGGSIPSDNHGDNWSEGNRMRSPSEDVYVQLGFLWKKCLCPAA